MSKYSPEFLTGMHREPMTLNFIKQAIKDRSMLEGLVIACSESHELTIEIGRGIIGKIPFEEVEYHYDGSPIKEVSARSRVGKYIKFIALGIEKVGDTYIVKCSRREAQKECHENFISKLEPGDIVPARLLRIEDYGIFCDIGCGIVALLPTNNISVTHIVNPKVILRDVKRLSVVIQSIDENYKIQLTHKELLGTWEENIAKFHEDEIVHGAVISVEDYGVFVRLSQNLSGLSELPDDIKVEPGNMVAVKINHISPKNMKVKLLIMDRTMEDEPESLKFEYEKTSGHMDEWHYSTPTAKKQIDSVFRPVDKGRRQEG